MIHSKTVLSGKLSMTYCFGILIEHFEVEIENARIGASGLLLDIERQLFHWVTGRYKINPGPIS